MWRNFGYQSAPNRIDPLNWFRKLHLSNSFWYVSAHKNCAFIAIEGGSMQTTKPPSLDGTTTADIKAQRERDFERGIFSTKKPTHGTFYYLAPFFATKWFCSFCSHDFEHWQSLYISVLVCASQLPKNPWSGRRKKKSYPKKIGQCLH